MVYGLWFVVCGLWFFNSKLTISVAGFMPVRALKKTGNAQSAEQL